MSLKSHLAGGHGFLAMSGETVSHSDFPNFSGYNPSTPSSWRRRQRQKNHRILFLTTTVPFAVIHDIDGRVRSHDASESALVKNCGIRGGAQRKSVAANSAVNDLGWEAHSNVGIILCEHYILHLRNTDTERDV